MQVQNNTPSAGYIAWSEVTVKYKNVTYNVANGNTNKKYVWWDFSTPALFQTSDTLPTLADTDFVAFYNDNGTYYLVSINIFHGKMILGGTISPDKLEVPFVFEEFPKTPSEAPDEDYEVANKKYVDDKPVGGGGGGDNLLKNPGFIDSNADGIPDFWTLYGTPTLEILPDTLFPSRGGNQLKMTAVVGYKGIEIEGSSVNWLKVLPSTTYTFSFDYKVAAGDALDVGIYSYNGDVDGTMHFEEQLTETTPTRKSYTFTTDADADNLYIWFYATNAGDIVYISHIKLEEGETATPYIPEFNTKGDLMAGAGNGAWQQLGVGSNGQVLKADSTKVGGVGWAAESGGVTDHGELDGLGDDDHTQYVLRSILTAAGDIFVLASDNTIVKLAKGSDTQVLAINLSKDPPLEWVNAETPGAHKESHQNEGADEINVGGLSGELADNQPPKTHAASHKNGGGDELKIIGKHTFTVPNALTIGTNKTLELFADTALTITEVAISVKTAPTGANLIVDVNKNGTTIFTTQGNRPTIVATETFGTSGAPDVTALAKNDKITIDIDQVGSAIAGADLTVMVRFTQVVS